MFICKHILLFYKYTGGETGMDNVVFVATLCVLSSSR